MPSPTLLAALCLAPLAAGAAAPFRPPGVAPPSVVAADPAPACADTRPECEVWAREGECVTNP